jgi:diketogulonate reductase-like aldo/keto reductase
LRNFCKEKGIVYQSFWTLSGNNELLGSMPIMELCREAAINKEAALYYWIQSLGNIKIPNGTTDETHMRQDLIELQRTETRVNDATNRETCAMLFSQFKSLVGEGEM